MSLKDQAPINARAALESMVDFGAPVTLTSPAGVASAMRGYTTDISATIDPETGQAVTGRRASAVLSLLSLTELPVAVHDSDERPWLVTMADATGALSTWKVIEVRPDRSMGIVVLILGGYGAAAD